jgi:hypothetical protein
VIISAAGRWTKGYSFTSGLADDLARVRACRHTGNEARLRELEAVNIGLRNSLEAADSAVRTAHAYIEKLERFIRSEGLTHKAGLH